MADLKHPTPWRVMENFIIKGKWAIMDADDFAIAAEIEDRETADLIVEAVNAHTK